jgi:GTP:adenosylcobinamide-phosphate guanylyltransferase
MIRMITTTKYYTKEELAGKVINLMNGERILKIARKEEVININEWSDMLVKKSNELMELSKDEIMEIIIEMI